MNELKIIPISDKPELIAMAAQWFHNKWGIPVEAYEVSMEESLKDNTLVPAWYLCLHNDKIVGGLGVIENDFHDRKDLTPNICAVYVEEDYRCKGIAGELLNFACEDMKSKGIDTLYLVTEHTNFYERYGWEFYVWCKGMIKRKKVVCTSINIYINLDYIITNIYNYLQ